MKATAAEAHILDITSGVNVLEKIELVGRTCYKSTDKICEGSAEKFVSNLVKFGHEAMLEHASFIFQMDYDVFYFMRDTIAEFSSMGFNSFITITENGERWIMSGNVRAFRDLFKEFIRYELPIPFFFKKFIKENPILFGDLMKGVKYEKYLFEGTMKQILVTDLKGENEYRNHCRVTVKFICDRGVSHEIVRHRPASFAQESTRYCNYTKDKFGEELTFIIPLFWDYKSEEWNTWVSLMEEVEAQYFHLIDDCGCTPEEARTILPNSLKTELIMTANVNEWHHFFDLRACDRTGKAHPQMKEVAIPLLDEFKDTFNVLFDDLTYGK